MRASRPWLVATDAAAKARDETSRNAAAEDLFTFLFLFCFVFCFFSGGGGGGGD
eukprot:SAG11_NODE_407_length_9712_cov_11.569437_10_plen_53_part_01